MNKVDEVIFQAKTLDSKGQKYTPSFYGFGMWEVYTEDFDYCLASGLTEQEAHHIADFLNGNIQ